MANGDSKFDSTSRWVEEDALAVVGGMLSDDERFDALSDDGGDGDDNSDLPSTLLDPPCSSVGTERNHADVLPLFQPPKSVVRSSSWQNFLMHMGPGFLMCIAYVDPGNLEADLQTGATTGYKLLWVLLYSTLLGGLLQSLAAKLGVSTSRHLAQHCRDMYPGRMRVMLWLMAELAIVGSDVQEVIGTSLAVMLLTGGAVKLYQGVVLGAVGAYVLLFLEKFGLRWLEAFFQVLVGILAVCMTALFFVAKVPYGEVLDGLAIPRLDAGAVSTAAGLLGAVLMPHNLFLHSALVHERGLPPSARSTAKRSLLYYKVEAGIALMVTLVINVAVISVFAHGFFGTGSGYGYGSEETRIGLFNAGRYLSERYGAAMGTVWALGLLAAGVSSTMTGTYAGQFVMSGFLDLKIGAFRRALLTRAVALVPTLAVALIFDDVDGSSFSSLDALNQWLNILQSIQLPFAIIPLLFLTSNPGVVGLGFVNSTLTNVVSGTTAAVVIAINIVTAGQTVTTGLAGWGIGWRLAIRVMMAAYVGLLVYLVKLSIQSLDVNAVIDSVNMETMSGEGARLLGDSDGGQRSDEEGDEEGDEGDGGKVETAGEFSYVPPIPIEAAVQPAVEPAYSVASSRAASLILSSRTGTRSHAVVALDND